MRITEHVAPILIAEKVVSDVMNLGVIRPDAFSHYNFHVFWTFNSKTLLLSNFISLVIVSVESMYV
jgi:hypothetical protein